MYLICRYSGQYEDFQETILGYVTSKKEAIKQLTLFKNDIKRIRREIEDIKEEYNYDNLNYRLDKESELMDDCADRIECIKSIDEGLNINIYDMSTSYGVVEIKELK